MSKKIMVDIIPYSEPVDEVLANALITNLMMNITQIGLRNDTQKNLSDIIRKETEDVKESK